jgi:DNA-binding transcriptional LysR family regulator
VPMALWRTQRLRSFWSWLPHFRAVAELQSVRKAAEALTTSASSLSRSVALLEHHLGHPLFDRVGSRLRLNSEGERLLEGTRRAMRSIDDVIESSQPTHSPVVSLSAPEPWTSRLLLPALSKMGVLGPHVTLLTLGDSETVQAIQQGAIDLAVRFANGGERLPAGIDCLRLGRVVFHRYSPPQSASRSLPLAISPHHPVLDSADEQRTLQHCSSYESALTMCLMGLAESWLPPRFVDPQTSRRLKKSLQTIAPELTLVVRRPLQASALSAWVEDLAHVLREDLATFGND